MGIHSGHECGELCGCRENLSYVKEEKMGSWQEPGEKHRERRQGKPSTSMFIGRFNTDSKNVKIKQFQSRAK